jgi:hypothetical protein
MGSGVQLRLTPLALIERLAALIPPPRIHRHRYHGVLAPLRVCNGSFRIKTLGGQWPKAAIWETATG